MPRCGGVVVLLAMVALSAISTGCAAAPKRPLPAAQEVQDYRLGSGDGLRLIFYGEEKLNGEYRIGADGRLALPLIGDIPAGGRTVPELREALAEAYRRGGFLLNPQIAVEILEYRPFFILGEVNAPGQYPFIPGMTVRQAIATAKGYTYRARQGKVLISHWGTVEEDAYDVAPGSPVKPGDTIRIPERHF